MTILNWSFPRKDISRSAQAYQLALALRDEVADLEAAGCKVIQVCRLRSNFPRPGWPCIPSNNCRNIRMHARRSRCGASGACMRWTASKGRLAHACIRELTWCAWQLCQRSSTEA